MLSIGNPRGWQTARNGALTILLLLMLFRISLPVVVANAEPITPFPIDPLAALKAKAQNQGTVRVIVQVNAPFVAEASQSNLSVEQQRQTIAVQQSLVLTKLQSGLTQSDKLKHVASLQFAPYMTLELDTDGLDALSAMPEVISVVEDMDLRPQLSTSVPYIHGDDVWNLGYDGSGQTVAIIDSGVYKTHNFLSGKVVSEACYSSEGISTCPNGATFSTATGSGVDCTSVANSGGYTTAKADCFHGTHVASTAAGDQVDGALDGVARGATIIAINASHIETGVANCGYTSDCLTFSFTDIALALERVYALRNTYNIAAVNLSLGCCDIPDQMTCDYFGNYYGLKPAIDNLRAAGIATIISSGNDGFTASLSFPGCISSAVSVGATNEADQIADFSNVASFLDLLAPGVSITAAYVSSPTAIASASGTSMAAPHVTGAWAVLKEGLPSASVDTILTAFKTTGTLIDDNVRADVAPSIGNTGGGRQNIPLINLLAAYNSLPVPTSTPTAMQTLTHTPTPSTTTPTATSTSVSTPFDTPTDTPVASTDTPTAVATPTEPGAETLTPTATAASTLMPTNTPLPPTSTATNPSISPTDTATHTPVPSTSTATNTPVPPDSTATNTPVLPTSTATDTPVSPIKVIFNSTVTLTSIPPECAYSNQLKAPVNAEVRYCYTVINKGTVPIIVGRLVDSHLGVLLENADVVVYPGVGYTFAIINRLQASTTNVATWSVSLSPQASGADVMLAEASATVLISSAQSDLDGDTIPDNIEGATDVDLDFIPNFRDADSDGDDLLDINEGTGDRDGDGVPNFLDPIDDPTPNPQPTPEPQPIENDGSAKIYLPWITR